MTPVSAIAILGAKGNYASGHGGHTISLDQGDSGDYIPVIVKRE